MSEYGKFRPHWQKKNMSREEKKALKGFGERLNCGVKTIIQGSMVAQDYDKYKEEILRQISIEKFYRKLSGHIKISEYPDNTHQNFQAKTRVPEMYTSCPIHTACRAKGLSSLATASKMPNH